MGVPNFSPPDMPRPENSDVPVIFRKGVGTQSLGIRVRVVLLLTAVICAVGFVPWVATRLVLAGWVPLADTVWLTLFLEVALLIGTAYFALYFLEDVARYLAQKWYWWSWLRHEEKNQGVFREGTTAYQNKWLKPEKERQLVVNVGRDELNRQTKRVEELEAQLAAMAESRLHADSELAQIRAILNGQRNLAAARSIPAMPGMARVEPSAVESEDESPTIELVEEDADTQELDLMAWYRTTPEYCIMERALAGASLSIPALEAEGLSRFKAKEPKAKLIACNMLLAKEGREPILHPDYKNATCDYVHQVAAVKLAEYRPPSSPALAKSA